MSDFFRACRTGLGNLLSPSGREHFGLERLAGILLLLSVVGGILFFHRLPASQQVVLWGLVILIAAILLRRGWLKLFGPVLFFELVRTARRTRFIFIRTLYALALAGLLIWLFFVLVIDYHGQVPTACMANFASYFFYTFMVFQFVTVVLLTPPYTAGAIAEEKERKTLEFVLATDLRNREIVLGKVVARLFNLTFLLLAGLPILAFLQFLGGIDPGLVLAGFTATALTMFSLGGFSIFSSVTLRRARDAIAQTYLGLLAYYLLSSLSLLLFLLGPRVMSFPSTNGWSAPFTLGDLVEWFNAGNIGYAIYQLDATRSTVLEQVLPGVLRDYVIFHGLVGLVGLILAIWRLRAIALREQVLPATPRLRVSAGRFKQRGIGTFPLLWKEIFIEGGLRLNTLGRIVTALLILGSFLPTAIALYFYFDGEIRTWWEKSWFSGSRFINIFQLRMMGTGVACLLWLPVVVRAAGSISGERDRNTLDSLLTTRLSPAEIVFAKWVGAVLSVRWGWLWLGLIWVWGVVSGGMNALCQPLLIVSWLVYAVLFAGVGLYFSATARRTLRAVVAALATTLVLLGGHWLLSGICNFSITPSIVRELAFLSELVEKFQTGAAEVRVIG
jgi:ABC-type transport system involved in multi-copper enzyme maturation permease subunit